jgi:hypothetical protein
MLVGPITAGFSQKSAVMQPVVKVMYVVVINRQ